MAELITTQAEKAAASYLDWDDAALGRFVKYAMLAFKKSASEIDRVLTASAALHLVHSCVDIKAAEFEGKLEGVTINNGTEVGDWEIKVRKL